MAAAMKKVGELDRAACRAAALTRFSLDAMVEGYFAAYAELARTRNPSRRLAS
jgi:hypothetical protein